MSKLQKLGIGLGAIAAIAVVAGFTVVALRLANPQEDTRVKPMTSDGIPAKADPQARATIAGGVQFHCIWSSYTDAERAETLDKIEAANIDRVRIDMAWAGFEEAKGQYNQWYADLADRCVDMARDRGLEVLITMHMTPDWANGNKGIAAPPNNPQDFGDFMAWSADHFKNRVSAYQIWNEPNPAQQFFTGTTSQYVAMLKSGYKGVKKSDTSARVVLGGPSTNDDVWIEEVYELGGKDYFDILATQPYLGQSDAEPEHPDDGNPWWLTHFPSVLNVMKKYGDEKKEVWFTEFGYSTHENEKSAPPYQRGVSESQQAIYLIRAFEYVQKSYPTVSAMYVYNARDRIDADTHNNNFGIMTKDLTPKPSYYALQQFFKETK